MESLEALAAVALMLDLLVEELLVREPLEVLEELVLLNQVVEVDV